MLGLIRACYERSKMHYGTSWTYPRCLSKDFMKDYLSSNSHNNPFFYNWNLVQVKYCDGTSYSSDIDLSYKVRTILSPIHQILLTWMLINDD